MTPPSPPAAAKDPTAAFMLSLFLPGLGFAYAGNARSFLVFLALELFLWFSGWIVLLVVVHVFQAVAAAGAARLWNQQHASAGPVTDIPPPPPPGSHRASAEATPAATSRQAALPPPIQAPPAVPSPPPAALDAEGFLTELQSAWREHRNGKITARQFADRKFQAIRGVRAQDAEDADALVAAARELEEGGVLTSEEVAQLRARLRG